MNQEQAIEQTETNEIVTPLHKLIEANANAMIEVDRISTSIDLLQKQINDVIAEQFPQLQAMQDELSEARTRLNESESMLKAKALQVDPSALAQYGRAVYVAERKTHTLFDSDKALQYIRNNRLKAERLGLYTLKTTPSAWVKAVANGSQFPEDIVTVETVKSVRTSDTLIKQFATGE